MSPLPDDPAFVQQQDQVGVGNGAEVVRIVRQVLPAMRDVRASRTLASLSTSNIRSRPLKTSQRRGYARRKRSVPRLSRIGAGSVRRTRGQCSFYINEWPPWGKTFTPCAYFRLGYFQAVAAKRPSISLADGPELR